MNRPAPEPPPARVPFVGFITIGRAGAHPTPNLQSFLQGLREHDWVDGENITVEFQFAEPWEDQHPALASDLVRRGVDVICCSGLPAIRAAKAATGTIPIVMVFEGGAAVAAGLVDSLERPSGNVTGQTTHFAQLSGKRLELLQAILPSLATVAVLWNPSAPEKVEDWGLTQAAGQELGLQLLSLEVQTLEELPGAFDAAIAGHADGLLVLSDPLTWRTRRQILQLAAEKRLPAVHPVREFVDAGGLASYGPNGRDMYRRAAAYVDKLLRGAKPADLPIQGPAGFELVINQSTAKALSIAIPQSILAAADDIVSNYDATASALSHGGRGSPP